MCALIRTHVKDDDPVSSIGKEGNNTAGGEEEEEYANESGNEAENEDVYEKKMMGTVCFRLEKIHHDYAVLAWSYSVCQDVTKYVNTNYSTKYHMDTIKRAMTKPFHRRNNDDTYCNAS